MSGKPVTAADLDTADVHEARALLAGKDECRCAVCKRVAKSPERAEQVARALSKRSGMCMDCARSGMAQGYCCGHPSRQPRPARVTSYPDNSFYN